MIPFKYGEPSPTDDLIWESETYDSEGRIIKRQFRPGNSVDSPTNILYIQDFTYENDQLIEMEEWSLSGKSRHVYTYSDNRLTKEEVYDEDGLIEKFLYFYSGSSSNPSEMHYWWNFFDNPPTIHTYKYDSRGNKIEEEIDFQNEDEENGVLYWEYDNYDNVIKESYRSPHTGNVSTQYRAEYEYANQGDILIKTFTSSMYYVQQHKYGYKENGSIHQIDVFEAGDFDETFEQVGRIEYSYTFN